MSGFRCEGADGVKKKDGMWNQPDHDNDVDVVVLSRIILVFYEIWFSIC